MQAIIKKSLPGQYIHWIDDKFLKVLVLRHNPNGLKCDKAPIPGLRQCLLLSPKKTSRGKNNNMIDLSKFEGKIVDKIEDKKKLAFIDIQKWYAEVKTCYKFDDDVTINDSLVMGIFPSPGITSSESVEKFCIDVDYSRFFSSDSLLQLKNETQKFNCNHLRPTEITPRMIKSCIFPNFLTGEVLSIITSYIYRNEETTKDFLLWPATLRYLFKFEQMANPKKNKDMYYED